MAGVADRVRGDRRRSCGCSRATWTPERWVARLPGCPCPRSCSPCLPRLRVRGAHRALVVDAARPRTRPRASRLHPAVPREHRGQQRAAPSRRDVLRAVGFRRQLRSRSCGCSVPSSSSGSWICSCCWGSSSSACSACRIRRPAGAAPSSLRRSSRLATWLAGLGIAALAGLVLLSPWLEDIRGSRFLAERRWAGAASEQVTYLAEAFGVVRSAPRLLALLGLSAIVWICEGAVFVCVAAAFAAGGMAGPWFSMAIGSLSTLLPSMPGHVGTFDYFTAQGLAVHGASLEVATAFALAVHRGPVAAVDGRRTALSPAFPWWYP